MNKQKSTKILKYSAFELFKEEKKQLRYVIFWIMFLKAMGIILLVILFLIKIAKF